MATEQDDSAAPEEPSQPPEPSEPPDRQEPPEPPDHQEPPELPRTLFHALATDQGHLAERLAGFAVSWLGAGAGRTAARLRERDPDASLDELRTAVIDRGRRESELEGAFVGGPFIVMVPFAFCAALLAQIRMVLTLAALAGHETTTPESVAHLLVLQGVHPDLPQARAAFAALPPAEEAAPRYTAWPRAVWRVVSRMAKLLGLVTPDREDRDTGRVRAALRWVPVLVVFAVGTVAPLVWLPYLGFSYHRATNELGERAVRYYAGPQPVAAPPEGGTAPPVAADADGGPREQDGSGDRAGAGPEAEAEERPVRTAPAVIGAGIRALLTLLVPAAAVGFAVVLDLRVLDSRWPVFGILLIVFSAAAGAAWRLHHHRRIHALHARDRS
ncbi:hypothetical protein [Kitasatospora camelliae]|uniref:Uncharacterized protein n=1 Tax=Kitasatospora camelliae TaxID=3156397 RepID=A0AAU8JZ10_9ACTN